MRDAGVLLRDSIRDDLAQQNMVRPARTSTTRDDYNRTNEVVEK